MIPPISLLIRGIQAAIAANKIAKLNSKNMGKPKPVITEDAEFTVISSTLKK